MPHREFLLRIYITGIFFKSMKFYISVVGHFKDNPIVHFYSKLNSLQKISIKLFS